jgi:AcrR family transcriptional regulator
MKVLSVKGCAKASIADRTRTAGIGYDTVYKEFGTKDDMLRAAMQCCAAIEASRAHEPLGTLTTGRAAIGAMQSTFGDVSTGQEPVAAS